MRATWMLRRWQLEQMQGGNTSRGPLTASTGDQDAPDEVCTQDADAREKSSTREGFWNQRKKPFVEGKLTHNEIRILLHHLLLHNLAYLCFFFLFGTV